MSHNGEVKSILYDANEDGEILNVKEAITALLAGTYLDRDMVFLIVFFYCVTIVVQYTSLYLCYQSTVTERQRSRIITTKSYMPLSKQKGKKDTNKN